MYILFPFFCILAIAFGIWLAIHTIKTAWNESIKTDPNHDSPTWDD